MPKFKFRFLWWCLVIAWLVSLALWFLYAREIPYLPKGKVKVDHDGLFQLFSEFYGRNPNMTSIHTQLGIYTAIEEDIGAYNFLNRYSFKERCNYYFGRVNEDKPNWLFNPNEKIRFEKSELESFEKFKNEKIKKWQELARDALKSGNEAPAKPTEDELKRQFQKFHESFEIHEQSLHDFASHTRIFKKCYMDEPDRKFIGVQKQLLRNVEYQEKLPGNLKESGQKFESSSKLCCGDVEENIFPFLTKEYPQIRNWEGEIRDIPASEDSKCFLKNFKQKIAGKGIVMTLKDGHIDDAARLIRVLRYLRNTYPIQVVYHRQLSGESKQKLTNIARENFHNFPQQDIWFVNVENCIKKEYLHNFDGFANKILAVMFNTFQDMLFLDADSVVLKQPDYFFKLKKYVSSGAFFYKDRYLIAHRNQALNDVFRRLLPSVYDSAFFGIAQTGNHTLNNEFFQFASTHYMESGVVVVNRQKHFMLPFMMALLSFHDSVTSQLYGDKEFFWLSSAILGEDYAMNEHFAASSGTFTAESERHKDLGGKVIFDKMENYKSLEICSNHPSHIDSENSLVWLNSGFRFCGNSKNPNWDYQMEYDGKTRYSHFAAVQDFKIFFESKLEISHAIIPPYYADHTRAKNAEFEPETPWKMATYCKGYCWCAYSLIGGNYEDEEKKIRLNRIEGKIIEFLKHEQKLFGEIGDIWVCTLPWDT